MGESNSISNSLKPAVTQTPRQKQFSSKRRLVMAICLVVLVAGGVAAILILNRPKAFVSQKHVVYSRTQQFLLPGPSSGNGISLQKPVELTQNSAQQSNTRGTYYQYIVSSSPKVVQAELDLSIAPVSNPVTSTYLDAANAAFASPTSSDTYKALMTSINMFVKSNVGQVLSYKLGAAKPFTSSAIKNNAWQFDLTITPKDSQANSTAHSSSYNGKVIYALSNQTAYYISIMDIDYNWQGNQPTWQKVLDSLKIDQ